MHFHALFFLLLVKFLGQVSRSAKKDWTVLKKPQKFPKLKFLKKRFLVYNFSAAQNSFALI